jgi:pyruvate,water dikinase
VDKTSFEILDRTISPKTICYQLEGNKVVCVEPSVEKQNQQCVNDEALLELVRLGKLAEAHYQSAQDLEWAIDEDLPYPENIFLVQSRPVTKAGKPKQSDADIIIDMMSSLFRR